MKASNHPPTVRNRLALLAGWFVLTAAEKRVVLLVLAILLVGLSARWWHVTHPPAQTGTPPATEKRETP